MTVDTTRPSAFSRLCERHFRTLVLLVLALAAFNLTFRLGREIVTEWDESLYAISATEMATSGNWIGVTYLGDLDYYNSKPPLNIWLISVAFKLFGTNLWSLRIVSAGCAWCTVLVLTLWGRRCFGAAVGVTAGMVLATSFGFLYVHSGRSANTDALFTLLVLLTVVVLWAADRRPWHAVWLGPILAAAFLLRGMAVLMPLVLVVAVKTWRRADRRADAWPSVVAGSLFAAPVAAWSVARWKLDGWRFFQALFGYDFVARTVGALEGHDGGVWYYATILLKHHYEWIAAAAIAGLLFPVPWRAGRRSIGGDTGMRPLLILSWIAVTLIIPTVMRTKLPWYLNTFYPVFALGTAWLLVQGLSPARDDRGLRGRHVVLLSVVIATLAVAETKLLWYSYHYRDLRRSTQGLLLAERGRLHGRRVFCSRRHRGEAFVLGTLGTDRQFAETLDAFLHLSRSGDYWLASDPVVHPEMTVVRSNGRAWLYCRR
jgi:4-amino-4-deoxy-L-arabinose transferase-like glycosyltransferase